MQNTLDQILLLCDKFLSMLHYEQKTINRKNFSFKVRVFKKNDEPMQEVVSKEQIGKFGFILVSRIRQYLLQEEIKYNVGIQMAGELVGEKILSYQDLLDNMDVKISNTGNRLSQIVIKLNEDIIKIDQKNKQESLQKLQSDKISLLQQVLSWATVKSKYGENEKDNTNIGPEHKIYKKESADVNVYFAYVGQKNNRIQYYYDNKIAYNRGWIYEWFNEKYSQFFDPDFFSNGLQYLKTYVFTGLTPLEDLFFGVRLDSNIGTRIGDYAYKNQQYQAKLGNNRISTLNQIVEDIEEIKRILELRKSGISKEKTIDALAKLYSSVEGPINTKYTKILNEILDPVFLSIP